MSKPKPRETPGLPDLLTVLAMVKAGLLTGADLEEVAGARSGEEPTATAAAHELYEALVREIVAECLDDPEAREWYGVRGVEADSDPEKEIGRQVRNQLGFPYAHMLEQERNNFRATLVLRKSGMRLHPQTFVGGGSLALELAGNVYRTDSEDSGMSRRVPRAKGANVPIEPFSLDRAYENMTVKGKPGKDGKTPMRPK
jgi:hypothetical protein